MPTETSPGLPPRGKTETAALKLKLCSLPPTTAPPGDSAWQPPALCGTGTSAWSSTEPKENCAANDCNEDNLIFNYGVLGHFVYLLQFCHRHSFPHRRELLLLLLKVLIWVVGLKRRKQIKSYDDDSTSVASRRHLGRRLRHQSCPHALSITIFCCYKFVFGGRSGRRLQQPRHQWLRRTRANTSWSSPW
jgi:hypothetical protein